MSTLVNWSYIKTNKYNDYVTIKLNRKKVNIKWIINKTRLKLYFFVELFK